MELTREEKQALEEKYKEQRRSMWAGKRSSDNADDHQLEEISENSEEDDSTSPDDQDAQPARPESDNILARMQALDEDLSDAVQRHSAERSSPETADESEQAQPTTEDVTSQPAESATPETDDDTREIIEKIREQREDTWEGNSATRSRRRRQRRKTSSKEREFWNPTEQEKGPSPFTWKLGFGVFGAIIVLVGIGILLGYWFAS